VKVVDFDVAKMLLN